MGVVRVRGPVTGKAEIYYPESDGKPMAETDLHWLEMVELKWMLQARYAGDADVYVASNLLLYYEDGNPRAAVAPDVFVVFGVPKALRRVYKVWAEGAVPAVVIEVSSRLTRREDLHAKMAVYGRIGVDEYVLYDPEADYLRPPLQAFRLGRGGSYVPVTPDADGQLASARLGLRLGLEGGLLQLYDSVTGVRLRRAAEREAALDRAEAELVVLREEIARLRGRDKADPTDPSSVTRAVPR